MKKNALQIITLILCAVLLVMNVRQGRKLEEYRRQVENDLANQYNTLRNDLNNLSNSVEQKLEEGAQLVADYGLEPVGMNKVSRSLQADVVVTLKEWGADTAVELLAKLDGKETVLPMTTSGSGEFACALEVPTEQNCELWLDVTITSGGMTRREQLGGWGELSMLLPVQMYSWGGSAPVFRDGFLSIGQQTGHLEGRDGAPARAYDICYRLYVNGEKVKEEARCENWLQECAEGDEVCLTLFCRDEYGLGYEFTMDEFVCDEDASDLGTGSVVSNGTASPLLSWD
ncbi:MAG: hypothetical protein IKU81_05060 [Oscillibacter sp.]|nr:hypothetical protein [Oscillibacter sp.]